MTNGQPQKVIVTSTKNVGIAILLAFLFGPLGMFYSTISGAIVMLILYPIVGFLTIGLGLFILHPIAIIWAAVAANTYNKKLLAGS
jgi:hypothetical protein